MEASWDPVATPRILRIRPGVVIRRVLGGGGEEPGGGEQASRSGSQSSRTVGQRSHCSLEKESGQLDKERDKLDRGKDYPSQPDAPGKQGPADILIR